MKKMFLTLFLTLTIVCFSTSSQAENFFFSGNNMGSFLTSMVNGGVEFPKRFNTSAQPPLEHPEISLFIQKNHINAILTAYLKKPIVLGNDKNDPASTLQADKVFIKPDPQRNVLQVFIKGGILNLTQAYAGIEGKLVITDAEFEILPHISQSPENKVMLEARLRLVNLDIDQSAPVIDIGIANLLQNLYFNDQTIEALNLSDYVNTLQGPEHIDLNLAQAAVLMKTDGIEIQTAWNVSP